MVIKRPLKTPKRPVKEARFLTWEGSSETGRPRATSAVTPRSPSDSVMVKSKEGLTFRNVRKTFVNILGISLLWRDSMLGISSNGLFEDV